MLIIMHYTTFVKSITTILRSLQIIMLCQKKKKIKMMSLSKNGSHVKLLWSDASFLNAYHLFYHKQFGMLFFIFYFNHLLGNQGI